LDSICIHFPIAEKWTHNLQNIIHDETALF
jgi:hypothetical protein